jgi:hypothetical protein
VGRLQWKAAEYNLTDHCNLRCAACNHASPHLPAKFASPDEFERDLRALAAVLEVSEFKLVGGEPLLHPQLVELAGIAREVALGRSLSLFTNGLLLHKMPLEAWRLIDTIYVSVYPGIKYPVPLDEFDGIAREQGVQLRRSEVREFELAMLNTPIDDDALVEQVFSRCLNKDEYACHTIFDGRYYKCSPAPFMTPRLARRGITFENRGRDGVAIHDNPRLKEELEQYLFGGRPLIACTYCLGTSGPRIAHRQLDRAALAAELAEDHSPLIAAARLALGRPVR